MATRKHTQAAPAAPVNHFTSPAAISPEAVYRRALSLLNEVNEEKETVLSVAIAGARFAGDEAVIERRLFNVIAKVTEDIHLITELREELASLAKHAGLAVEVQS